MLKDLYKNKIVILLATLTTFCFLLIAYRIFRFHNFGFIFLIWNLFLAGLPLVAAYFLKNEDRWRFKSILLFLFCLGFLPNAPYILTDVIHLNRIGTAPIWYDLFLVLSFALTGLLFGQFALIYLSHFFEKMYSKTFSLLAIIFICFLSGFGVYLGRFLRWNSWDVINNPYALGQDIADRVIYPLDHPRTYFVTLSTGFLLSVLFLSYKFVGKSDK